MKAIQLINSMLFLAPICMRYDYLFYSLFRRKWPFWPRSPRMGSRVWGCGKLIQNLKTMYEVILLVWNELNKRLHDMLLYILELIVCCRVYSWKSFLSGHHARSKCPFCLEIKATNRHCTNGAVYLLFSSFSF